MMLQIIQVAVATISNQPNVLYLQSPINIIGDIHGQFYDLLSIFELYGNPPENKYLFMGDYVDRGMFCIQVLVYLLALKIQYPKKIYLLRGNHETRSVTTYFNFKQECIQFKDLGLHKYDKYIYQEFIRLFNFLPICSVLDQTYFIVHAGISPELSLIGDLQKFQRYKTKTDNGIFCDLLWSDPTQENIKIWIPNQSRQCSYYYSTYFIQNFLNKNGLKMIIRGHEVQLEGFKYIQSNENKKNLVLTLFSAPNYCGTYRNYGAIAKIENNEINIFQFKESNHPLVLPHYQNVFEWTFPMIVASVDSILVKIFKKDKNNQKINSFDDDIQSIQKMLIIEKIFLDFEQTIKHEIIKFDPDKVLGITLQQFVKLKNQNIEKNPKVFGPKLALPQNKWFQVDQNNQFPDSIQDFND